MNFECSTTGRSNSAGARENSVLERKMVADALYSYNPIKSGSSISQPVEMIHPSLSQHFFKSPPLSLAQRPKMDSLVGMSFIGENYESDLIGKTREDEFDSRSGSDNIEAVSGEDHQNATEDKSAKRKKYHRHTALQIQELESAFKENPHPDEKGRLELGKRLGLEVKQVKFWFQNRRTQMKTQLERHENSMLKQENDKLRVENIAIKEAVRNPMCENCGSPAILGEISIEQHHLMIENARLKDELNRLGVLANKFLGKGNNGGPMPPPRPMMYGTKLDLAIGRDCFGGGLSSMEPTLPLGLDFHGNRIPASSISVMPPNGLTTMANADVPFDKSLLLDLALAAMDELLKLGQADAPMWFRGTQGDVETLNLEEYAKAFSPSIGPKPVHFVTEATRASGTVIINGATLVEALMDVNQWTEIFPGNIGRAITVSVISDGVSGNRNGALQLMQAELQAFSAIVPVRQLKFIRYCKQYREDMWAVVDLSVDFLFHGNTSLNCRRLPSGCIVQDLHNGCSKVTWIEHTEYDKTIIPSLCQPLVTSGLAFGAPKWLANLQRQCQLFATVLSSLSPNAEHPALSPDGKKSIIKLSQRMTRSFCMGISSTVHNCEVVQDTDDVRMMMRKSVGGDSGEPRGLILSATTTVWFPLSPHLLFEFLHNENNRRHWDVLCRDGPVHNMLRVPKAREDHLGNAISVLRANVTDHQKSVFILQDTSTDLSGSLVVYAAVESTGMNVVMSGGDSSNLAILPSGFSIVPDCFPGLTRPENGGSGSLLTIGFQILANSAPGDKLTMESVNTVKSLIGQTLEGIKANLRCD